MSTISKEQKDACLMACSNLLALIAKKIEKDEKRTNPDYLEISRQNSIIYGTQLSDMTQAQIDQLTNRIKELNEKYEKMPLNSFYQQMEEQ